jgi:hypothetical protein
MSQEHYGAGAGDVQQFHVRLERSTLNWLVLILWPVVVAVGAIYLVAPRALGLTALRADVAARPPIAIIDRDASILRNMGRDPSNDAMAAAQGKVDAATQKLRAAGYVVLDAKNVAAYPKDFEASP